MNDETRAWSRRYFEKMKKMPDMDQAGVYSSILPLSAGGRSDRNSGFGRRHEDDESNADQ